MHVLADAAVVTSGQRLQMIEKQLSATTLKIGDVEADLRTTREVALRASHRVNGLAALAPAHLNLSTTANVFFIQ